MSTNPIASPRAFNTFTLDADPCPGLAMIKSGGEREQEWQEQQTPGVVGANLVFRLEHVTRIAYEVTLWLPEHFPLWDAFIAKLNAGKAQRPPKTYALNDLRVAHNQIKRVAFWKCGPQVIAAPGRFTYELGFVEKNKPRPMGGAVKAPANEIEAKIAALSGENAGLQAKLDTLNAAAAKGK